MTITTRTLRNGDLRYDVSHGGRRGGRRTFSNHNEAQAFAAAHTDYDEANVERAMCGTPPPRLSKAERYEAIARLNTAGLSDAQIGDRVGIAATSVLRIRVRRNIPAVAQRTCRAPAPRRAPRPPAPFTGAVSGAIGEEGWRAHAVCRGMASRDDDIFFDPDTEWRSGGRTWQGRARRQDTVTALAFCRVCPVVAQCLDLALTAEHARPYLPRAGIFGGTTPAQRDRLAGTTRRRTA